MRRLLSFLGRPGVFIAVVGIVVCVCASGLWGGMSSRPDAAPAASGSVQDINPAIARALLSMAHLAYEEPFEGHLEDSVKQVDFALLQAMLRNDMPIRNAVVEKAELRHNETEAYHFQRVRLTVGHDSGPFVEHLGESLKAWAESARFAPSGTGNAREAGELWTITVGGVVTHELVLASLPAATPGGTDGPGRVLRRRAPGEVARLVIVIDDIGEDMRAARTLAGLSYPVTLAVWPRSTHARKAAELAHSAGLEVLIHQPTEPMKYPEMNPGPNALFTSLPDAEIETRVRDSISRVPHAVGMNNHMGSRFTRDGRSAAAMLRPLRDRGFFVLDSLTHPGSVLYAEARKQGIPALKRDVFLDSVPGREQVLHQLRKAEKIALMAGSAVAIGHPLPGTSRPCVNGRPAGTRGWNWFGCPICFPCAKPLVRRLHGARWLHGQFFRQGSDRGTRTFLFPRRPAYRRKTRSNRPACLLYAQLESITDGESPDVPRSHHGQEDRNHPLRPGQGPADRRGRGAPVSRFHLPPAGCGSAAGFRVRPFGQPHARRGGKSPGRPGRRRGRVRLFLRNGGHRLLVPVVQAGGPPRGGGRPVRRTFTALTRLFNDWGLAASFVDMTDLEAVRRAIRPETKCLYAETPSNPLLAITDLEAVASLAREHGLLSMVDNTFATPYLQTPMQYGFDLVLHSATKALNGHSDILGGFIVARTPELAKRIHFLQVAFGAVLGVSDSWLLLRGLRTLAVRMDAAQDSAAWLAHKLSQLPEVRNVYYPTLPGHPGRDIHLRQARGGGAVLSFELESGTVAREFLRRVRLPLVAVSLGGIESILSYPVTMSHSTMPEEERRRRGISDALIRFSVGLESREDLLADVTAAIAASRRA